MLNKKKNPSCLSSVIFSRGRRAQSERPVSVSGGAVHAANHSVPWLRSKHRSRKSQRSPQCTEVPQNHGWREVISLATAQTPSHRHTMGWVSVLDTGSTFVIDLNNMKIPQNFGPWNLFWSCRCIIFANEDFYHPKPHALDILHIWHK